VLELGENQDFIRLMKSGVLVIGMLALTNRCSMASEYDVQRGCSPSGAIRYVTSGDKARNKIWLGLTERPNEWIELCAVDKNHVWLTFSPDEQWVLLYTANDDPLKHRLRLFKRGKGPHFSELEGLDIGNDLQALILKESGEAQTVKFKGMIHTAFWSADSAAFLLCATGEADVGKENSYVNPWFCVYEVATGKFGFDISKYNGS